MFLQDRFPCGKDYWILNWGFKYCKKFSNELFSKSFTQNGTKVIDHINKCLPNSIKKLYVKNRALNCKTLHDNAFKFQQKCYEMIQNDFCIGFSENKRNFLKIIDNRDLSNLASILMMKNIISKCNPPIDFMGLLTK